MERIKPLIGFALVMVFAISCERQDNHSGPLSVTVSSDMECKSNSPLKTTGPGTEQSCVHYKYDGDSLLSLRHFNAGFNCCPGSFPVDIEIKGDSLIISEDDAQHGCKCNCLFDLDMKVHNLPAGICHVRIVESYANFSWPLLIFDLDLEKVQEGEFCVTRPVGWWR